MTAAERQRFWDKVAVGSLDECWIWTAARNTWGYGAFHLHGRQPGAHRVAYEMACGPIPPDMQIDHLCRVRACVNPLHLEVVTQRENLRRGLSPTGLNAAKTVCRAGHSYDAANLHVLPDGRRRCRACARRSNRRYRDSRRAAAA